MADTVRALATLRTNLADVSAPTQVSEQAIRDLAVSAMNGGANASTTDGATIAHGCPATPTCVQVTGSVAGEIVSATGVDGTNITVAIKKRADGSAGTSQTVYWMAWA